MTLSTSATGTHLALVEPFGAALAATPWVDEVAGDMKETMTRQYRGTEESDGNYKPDPAGEHFDNMDPV